MKRQDTISSEGMLRRLTPQQLRWIGTRLFGEEPGWQSRVADELGVSRGAVTRWLSGDTPIQTPASLALQYMLKAGLPGTIEDPLGQAA